MIAAENLRKAFAGTAVLDGVSLTIAPGETVVLSGPSGAGKTSLLRILAGLDAPDGGRVTIDGRTVTCGRAVLAPPHDRGLGVVFQAPTLWPHMSVARNVAFGITGASRSQRAERVRALAEELGFAALLRRRPASLSTGQARRVALARALAPRPRYLLMDEPTTNLDVAARAHLNGHIRKHVALEGVGLLYVSHEPWDATQLGGRRYRLASGHLERLGQGAGM